MLTFAGNKYTDINEYAEAMISTSAKYGGYYAGIGLIPTVAKTLTPTKAQLLLKFGRIWIELVSAQADLNRRRYGSKAYHKINNEIYRQGGIDSQCITVVLEVAEAWPDLRTKELRHLAAMVAGSIDKGIDFNPCPNLQTIIDTCRANDN